MTIRSDNSVTVYNLQRQGAGTALLNLTREIFSLLEKLDIRIHVCHIPGVENVTADRLSRMESSGDYALKPEFFRMGCLALRAVPTVDLFAHALNNKYARFVALPGELQRGAWAIDAFSQRWDQGLPYIFPPVQIVDRVLQRLVQDRATALVVVPKWTGQPWWGLLRPMAKAVVELGSSDQVLIPGPIMTQSKSLKKLPPGIFIMALIGP
jgi:hypothetical protein